MLQMPAQEGDIQSVEKTMIRRMFNFSEITAQEIMVPLIDVAAIEKNAVCGDAEFVATEKAHIHLPVYDKRVDKVIGVLHALEFLGMPPDEPIQAYIRPVRYVSGSKQIKELLLELRQARETFAVVVDEFGGSRGIVTIEDIMEEVVEDIEDEYDDKEKSSQWIRKISDHEYIVSARLELDTLSETLKIDLPRGKYATLAGFLLEHTGEVPAVGSVIKLSGISFTIYRSIPQAILEVRIRI